MIRGRLNYVVRDGALIPSLFLHDDHYMVARLTHANELTIYIRTLQAHYRETADDARNVLFPVATWKAVLVGFRFLDERLERDGL